MNARLKDPALRPEDAVSWLDVQLRDEGSIEIGNWCVYFDPVWEERYDGMDANEPRIEIVPSFVLSRHINGTVKKTPHASLLEALREVERGA
jgi:hypothetical protein